MKRSGAAVAAAAAICLAVLAGTGRDALAGHPFGTEDAGTQGKGNVEVEFNLERRNGSDGSRTTSLGNGITMGVAPKVDLAVGYSYDFAKDPAGVRTRGMGDVEAQLKTSFNEGDGRVPTLGIKGGVSLPAEKGGQTAILATVIAEWAFEPFTVFANAGADIGTHLAGNDERETLYRASVAGAWEIRESLNLVSELLWEKPSSAGASVELLAGLQRGITDALTVDAGVRWGIDSDAPDVTYLLGFTLAFQGTR
ncbi:MAG: transporter [Thermodesulfobacteriota bacterium]